VIIILLKREEKFHFIVEHSPGILTTLGLFGTFWGVAQGLGGFNVENIDGSVPELLSGMKLAFWTSILGMFFALCLNAIKFISGIMRQDRTEEDISASDIYRVMTDQSKNLTDLKQAIGGDGDHSLVTQLRLFKMEVKEQNALLIKESKEQNALLIQESREQSDLLIKEFRDFAAKMTENNSKALIEALKEVIRDFNAKISEQFGDNFKELNHAVGALLQWQENYKEQLEVLVSQFELALSGIEKSQLAIESISQNTASIPKTIKDLQMLLEVLNKENQKAHELLEGFVALRTQANEVFPAIKEGFENLTNDFSESVLASTHKVEYVMTTQSHAVETLVKKGQEQLIHADNMIRNGLLDIQGTFKKTLNDVEESTKKHYGSLDKQMEEELENALRILGSKLASISGKLVDDYITLTEKISNLISYTSQDELGSHQ
jgi:hypothetical protein